MAAAEDLLAIKQRANAAFEDRRFAEALGMYTR
jgi:hypothetical protein